MAILIATMLAQARGPAILPRFPGCPPEAVSSLCAPPPPPPPHSWDDPVLGERFRLALRDCSAVQNEIRRGQRIVGEQRVAVAAAAVGSPSWEAQRARISDLLAMERKVSRIQIDLAGYAEEHWHQASAGDRAAFETFRTDIDARRKKVAGWYMLQMRALIERSTPTTIGRNDAADDGPAEGDPARTDARAGGAPQ